MSIERIISGLNGYENVIMHFEGELRAANRIAASVTDSAIVVIGGFRSQMTCAIALHAAVPVYEIDPRQNWIGESRPFGDVDRPFSMRNILDLGLSERIRPINLPSVDVAKIWDKPIGMIYIDGNHEDVQADIDAWFPHVIDGGIIGFHDANTSTILDAITRRNDIVEFERADISVFYRKEPLYTDHTYDRLTLKVRRGPYEHDDRYVLGEVRTYDIGTETPRTICDIGGHIGAFSCWMADKYPDAQIVAVEPENSNFALLETNAAPYPNVYALHGRVGYDPTLNTLTVNPVNSGSHIIRSTVPLGTPALPAPQRFTIEDIMQRFGWAEISLLKIDAEGAECDILMNAPAETLLKCRRIIGEFHDILGFDSKPIVARLQQIGFDVTWETNPHAHAVFSAVNGDVTPFGYGTVVEKPAKKGRK